MATRKISVIHQEHTDWLAHLNFIEDEITCLKNELAYAHNLVQPPVCEREFFTFGNLLSAEQKKVEDFKGLVQIHENYISERARKGQHISIDPHEVLERIEMFFIDYNSLKQQTRLFIMECMQEQKYTAQACSKKA